MPHERYMELLFDRPPLPRTSKGTPNLAIRIARDASNKHEMKLAA